MNLEELQKRNRAFVAGRQAKPLPAVEALSLAVLACFDPRLDPLLRPALGLAEGEGFMLRTAGAQVTPDSSTLRSLAVAVFLFKVDQVLIVGHSSCRMASFDSASFMEAFRSRGVTREAFGNGGLRQWVGAQASPREGVLASAAAIAGAAFLPRDLAITGAILDDTTGALDVVLKPGDPLPGRVLDRYAKQAKEAEGSREASGPEAPSSADDPSLEAPATAAPGTVGAAAAAPPPVPAEAMLPTLQALQDVAHKLSKQVRVSDLRRLRNAYKAEANPVRKLEMLRKFVGQTAKSREVGKAFALLRHEAGNRGLEFASKTIEELFKPLIGEDER